MLTNQDRVDAITCIDEEMKNVMTEDQDRAFAASFILEAADREETHRQMRLDRRARLFSVIGSWLVLCALALFTTCCGSRQAVGRETIVQYDSAVRIDVRCLDVKAGTLHGWFGSGVIVNSTTLITAAHVANNPDGMVCAWRATMRNGHTYDLISMNVLEASDLATMRTLRGVKFEPTYPIYYGPLPKLGSRVCSPSGFPLRTRRCGDVELPKEEPGDIDTTMIVEPGNSGSGVYDDHGRLVGIVVHYVPCNNGQFCGSHASSLASHLRELGVVP